MAIFIAGFVFLSAVLPQSTYHRCPVIQYTTDKEVNVTVFLVSSVENQPLYYSTRLQSPVCMDNICNPIDIEIEWDLLGDFKTYNEFPDHPITKFDHQPLTPEDHEKLKSILANKASLLQDYRMEDLVDTTVKVYSAEIDAMTGATSKTFENDIVSGAVYTCYTLWNFVNGDLQDRLLEHTVSILNDDLVQTMIGSGQKNYLDYILTLDSKDFSTKTNEAIGSLIWTCEPIISVKAINAVQPDYWEPDSIRNILATQFMQKDIPIQNALIEYFTNVEVDKNYVSVFIDWLPLLRKNQKYQVYEILQSNGDSLDATMEKKLVEIFKSPGYSMTAKEYELLSSLGIQ